MTNINFDGKIFAADTETRTLRGLIVPFGSIGSTSAGLVEFHPEAFGQIKAEELVLNMEHDRTRPLGKGIQGSERITPAGIEMAFKIAPTTAGTDALIEASEGLRPAFSIEASADQYEIQKGVMKVSKATLTGVAHVTNPAFKAAQITEVAASEDEQTTEAEEAATELTEETTVENNNETAAAEVVEAEQAAAPVQASAPIRTAPRSPIVDGVTYLEHSIKAAMGSDESRQYIRAADDTSSNTGLTLAPHLNEFISTSIGGRPTIEAIGQSALPASGLSFTIPKLTQAPSVDEVDENGDPFGTPMTSDYLTVDVKKYAGAATVSWELIDRSSPAFLSELLREMQLAYAKATDVAVISALVGGGTDATAVAAGAAGLQSFIATESAAAYAGSGNFARNLVANTTNWAAIMGYTDDADRPLYNAAAPMNAAGNAVGTSIVGNVLGTNLFVDPHFGIGADEGMLLLAPEAATWYESAQRQVQVQVIGSGQIEVAVYGYGAIALKKPLGVRVYQQS
jgi:HK97 family phage major capsid protein